MSLFQILVVAVLVVMAAFTLSAGLRGTVQKRVVALGLAAWGLGVVAVAWPHTMAWLAHELGIGRGADLLLYLTALTATVACVYMYARFRSVERQLTLLVRRLAIHNAEERVAPGARSSLPSESVIAPRWEASDAKRGA